MQFAPTFLSAFVIVLSQVLPAVGINIGTEQLTTTVQTVVAIVGGIYILYRQKTTGRSTLVGTRP